MRDATPTQAHVTLQHPRVLVVAGDLLARAGLSAILRDSSDSITVVGQAAWNADLAATVRAFHPTVILWDFAYADPPALAAVGAWLDAQQSLDEPSSPPILGLLAEPSLAVQVQTTGIAGVVLRAAPPATLVAALIAVAAGLYVHDPVLAAPARLTPVPEPDVEPLTPRELEVLHLLAQGLPNKTIARRLQISEHTVKFHVNAILAKLDAQSRTEAVVRASRAGIILL